MSEEKITEQRLRRALAKKGYKLHKSRARHWSLDNQQGYMIVNMNNAVMAGGNYNLSLEDVEDFLNE